MAILDFWSAQNFYRKIQRVFSHIPIGSYDKNKHYGDGPLGSVISYNKLEQKILVWPLSASVMTIQKWNIRLKHFKSFYIRYYFLNSSSVIEIWAVLLGRIIEGEFLVSRNQIVWYIIYDDSKISNFLLQISYWWIKMWPNNESREVLVGCLISPTDLGFEPPIESNQGL
jgi:hypothetical protein